MDGTQTWDHGPLDLIDEVLTVSSVRVCGAVDAAARREAQVAELRQETSRHRHKHAAPSTPEGVARHLFSLNT